MPAGKPTLHENIESILGIANSVNDSVGNQCCESTFWSPNLSIVTLAEIAGTITLPSVVISGLPGTATLVRVVAIMKPFTVENTNGAGNGLDGATDAGTSQVIQVKDEGEETWYDCINFADNDFTLSKDETVACCSIYGTVDVKGAGKVSGDGTYEFRWLLAKSDLDNVIFRTVQMGLHVSFTV